MMIQTMYMTDDAPKLNKFYEDFAVRSYPL